MTMSRQHFEAIAKVIRNHVNTQDAKLLQALKSDTTSINTTDINARLMVLKQIANDMALMCASENPRFNKPRFMQACGFEY